MSDLSILAALVKSTLLEVANQSAALGIALQNAAPSDKPHSPNNSIQYLLTASDDLMKAVEHCEELMLDDSSHELHKPH